ncbi:MAG: hypothetical protein ACUVQ6_08745, partial [Dissulfurimicrobium sp.]|uniref:hypothetical protein n=1 Tax=Dissulfurimicrobium sp. TaxID=2022436 RepID=UPI00404A94A4
MTPAHVDPGLPNKLRRPVVFLLLVDLETQLIHHLELVVIPQSIVQTWDLGLQSSVVIIVG